ncbi:MAG: hypothetical protein V1492_06270 [Candidatus Micrarchaeota archaeon]
MNSGKLIFGLFVVFILLGAVHAADYSKEELLAAAKSLGIDTISGALGDISKEYENKTPAELEQIARNTTVVIGARADASEQAAWAAARAQYPEMSQLKFVEDDVANIGKIENAPGPVIFIGGPSQNDLMKESLDRGLIQTDRSSIGTFSVQRGTTKSGNTVIVISDNKGYDNVARKSLQYSPIAMALPKELKPYAQIIVPVASVSITAFLMLLLNAIAPFVSAFIEKSLQGWGINQVKLSPNPKRIFGIKLRQMAAGFGAACILAAAITYTFTGPQIGDFLPLFVLNIIICMGTYFFHDLVQLVVAKLYKLDAEFVFWREGAALTLFSAVLGSPFGLAGFLYNPAEVNAKPKSEAEEKALKESLGMVNLLPALLCLALAIFFAGINFLLPNVVFQMLFSILSFIALLDMIPIAPMSGTNIFRWNVAVWLFFFMPFALAYILLNYIL